MNRAELHCHTIYSHYDGTMSVREIFEKAGELKLSAIAITDHANILAYPDMNKEMFRMQNLPKIIFGMEGLLANNDKEAEKGEYHISILVQNEVGKNNLFHIISESGEDYQDKNPVISKKLLSKYRKGLLIGSGCYKGEIHSLIEKGTPMDEICKAAEFYDYLEVQPPINDVEKEQDIIRKIVELGSMASKPVIATGDVHYFDEKSRECMQMVHFAAGEEPETNQSMDMKDTEAMLGEFAFLGKEKAQEIVVTNSNKITEQIEDDIPILFEYFPFYKEKDDAVLKKTCEAKLKKQYMKHVPILAKSRLDVELLMIKELKLASVYLLMADITKKCKKDGYHTIQRGCAANSYVSYLLGITNVNPLKPHYYCEKDGYFEPAKDERSVAWDLPEKKCPMCDRTMRAEGYNLPYESLFGLTGDKVSCFETGFATFYIGEVERYLVNKLGPKKAIYSRNVGTLYQDEPSIQSEYYAKCDKADMAYKGDSDISDRLKEMTPGTNLYPYGMFLVPEDVDAETITPVSRYVDKPDKDRYVSHISRADLDNNLYKLGMCQNHSLEALHTIAKMTGEKITLDKYSIKEALKFISNRSATVLSSFYTDYGSNYCEMDMIKALKPSTLSELIKISGLSHSAYAFIEGTNKTVRDLVENGTITLDEAITCRDDVYETLLKHGVERSKAYEIAGQVRRGKISRKRCKDWAEYQKIMADAGVPDQFIKMCASTAYLFPRAHLAEFATVHLLLALYQKRHPKEFHAVYWSFTSDADGNIPKEYEEELDKADLDNAEFYKLCIETKDKIFCGKYRGRIQGCFNATKTGHDSPYNNIRK